MGAGTGNGNEKWEWKLKARTFWVISVTCQTERLRKMSTCVIGRILNVSHCDAYRTNASNVSIYTEKDDIRGNPWLFTIIIFIIFNKATNFMSSH